MNRPSYYDILGLTNTANIDEIKSAFRKLAKKYHPDKNVTNQTNNAPFIIINNAYQILVNETKKKEYDLYLYKIKNKNYTPYYTFKGYDLLVEKTINEFNYILWDIEDIINNVTESFIKSKINEKSVYSHILYFLKIIEEGILNEDYRFKSFQNKIIDKLHLLNYFYLLRVEVQKHIENMLQKNMEIEKMMDIKNEMTSFVSDMNKYFRDKQITNP